MNNCIKYSTLVYLFIQDGVCLLFEILCLYLMRALYILFAANCIYRCSRYNHIYYDFWLQMF